MPIRAPIGVTPPTPNPPTPTPAPPPKAKENFTWTPASGEPLQLSDTATEGIHLGGIGEPRTIIGLDVPPQEEFDTDLPSGGALANFRRWAVRPFSLPVVIHADTLDKLQEYRRHLTAVFNPTLGEGVFTVGYPNGERRHLAARYASGLDVAERGRAGYPYQDSYTIVMKARDPLPYGDEHTIVFDPPQSYTFFAPPGDQTNVFYISSATTTGDVEVLIDGEETVRPEWAFKGPASTATLRNRDTGQTLELTPNLPAGRGLLVDTDPRTPAAQKIMAGDVVDVPGGGWDVVNLVNVWATTAGQFPVLWPLLPGVNNITVNVNGTVPGVSSARLVYRPRYLVC